MRRRIELTLYTEDDRKTHRIKLYSNTFDYIREALGILNYTTGADYDPRHVLLIGLSIFEEDGPWS